MIPARRPPLGPQLESLLLEAGGRLRASRAAAALTGAGLSVESGIPPFRADVGLWDRYDPLEYGTLEAFERDPARVWMMLRELSVALRGARPNSGHEALAQLESVGILSCVVTQNIDGLHQEAGSRRVVELHGSWRTMTCTRCRRSIGSSKVPLTDLPPRCACSGVLKPDVTLFGEIIPAHVIDAAWQAVRSCDCLLVVGTSAEVSPASSLPQAARDAGACVIEINIDCTALDDAVVDLRLQGPAGVILPRLVEAVGAPREN